MTRVENCVSYSHASDIITQITWVLMSESVDSPDSLL